MKQESKQDIVLRLREALNAQQRSVPQLPAQARAKKISVLGAKTDPQHPFAGYAVGADEAAEPGHKVKSPDQNDPYEKGWRAGFRHDESNPYPAGSKQAAQWDRGYAEAEAQPDHYDEEVDLSEKLGALRPKLGTGHDVGKSVRKWRKQRGLSESDTQDKTDSNFFRKFSNLIAEAEQQVTEVTRRGFLKSLAGFAASVAVPAPVVKLLSTPAGVLILSTTDGIALLKSIQDHLDQWDAEDDDDYYEAWEDMADELGFESTDNEDNYHDPVGDLLNLYRKNPEQAAQQLIKHIQSKAITPTDVKASFTSRANDPGDWRYQARKDREKDIDNNVGTSTTSKSEPAAGPTTGMSGLARAAGAQIGRTATKLGKATATTILNQPTRDMGRIEPTMSPIALPAPTASTGMQIPKQKARVAAKQDKEGVSEATSDPKFDKMLKGITGKKAVAKQQKIDTKQQSRDAFGSMFGGSLSDLTKNLKIREQGVAEERNELDTPAVQAALAKMAERHRGEKWSKEQLAALGKRIAARGQKPVKEDDVADFLARGGKITQVKPNRGPRNPGLSLGSRHIGGGGDGARASRTGRGSKPQGKPVVAVEADVDEGWKSKLAGAALAGAAALGGGAQAQTAPAAGVNATGNNAAIVQSLVNPVAQQRFAAQHADTTAKLTDPRYTHNPDAMAQHQAAPQQQHAEMLQNIKNIEQWDNPYRIIQMAMNMAGVTPKEVLQNLPKGYKLPTTEPKTAPVRLPGDPGYVREGVTKEDIITKLKARLGDYLSDLSKEIKSDPDLINKLAAKPAGNQMGPPVKTITTDDGHQIQIHGNEDDGFRISIKNKSAATKFKNLDEAVMACEMYCARRRKQAVNADYVEEA